MNKPGKITSSSVFVVSGGARGITAQCVIQLAQYYRCTFILLGRSARTTPESAWVSQDAGEAELKKQVIAHLTAQGQKPTPMAVQKIVQAILSEREITATLRAIEQAGGRAEYISVDITDGAALKEQLLDAMQRIGPATGIIHGAGSLADKLIEKKTIEDFERVYDVKIKGLENLLACIPVGDLDYLILFASVAGFYGNIGQSDYAIANEIFNKTAHLIKRAYPACHVVAINWGPWDGGMVTPALKEHFARHNIAVIPLEEGTRMLIHELEQHHRAEAQVVIGDPIQVPPPALDPTLRTYRIHRRLSLEANPFLNDHIIGDHAVLPAVFGVAWMTNASEQLYPGYTFFSLRDYKVLKGIVFDETLADNYILDLKEIAKDEGEISFEGLVWSETADKKQRYHYTGRVTLRRTIPESPIYSDFDRSTSHVIAGTQLYQDGTLFHGPCFQGIEQTLNINPHKVTVRCFSPDITPHQQGQFAIQTFNPYLTDIQFQCMLVWVRTFYQAGGMPLGADRVEHFRSIRPGERFYVSMDVEESTESKLIATVTIHDEQGFIYMRVSGTKVTISTRLNSIFARSRPHVASRA